jgi:hypothetical protein
MFIKITRYQVIDTCFLGAAAKQAVIASKGLAVMGEEGQDGTAKD